MSMNERDESVRAGAMTGICFVVLFIGGVILLGESLDFAAPDSHFDAYFANANNWVGSIVISVLMAASAFVFIWFLYRLRERLQPEHTGKATLPNFMFASGMVFVVLLLIGTAAMVTVPSALAFGSFFDEQPFAVGKSVLPQFGYVMLALFGSWAAGVMVVAATLSARRSSSFPRWLGWLGLVASFFLFLFGPSVLGLFALPAWVLAVSLHWFRTPVRNASG